MYIIFGDTVDDFKSKYTILELDTVRIPGQSQPITAYCVIENIPIVELKDAENFRLLHENLMKNYRLKNWKYCLDAIEHLKGKWNGEVDSFYQEMLERIIHLQINAPGSEWDGTILAQQSTMEE